MPSVPDPEHVKPWYLRNITEALALDETTGNVYVRTGFTGNIVIEGNVNIPETVNVASSPENPVHVHVSEVGTSGILEVPYMPISGNVVITGNANIINTPNVHITNVPDVTGNITILSGNIRANVTQGTDPWVITGNANIVNIPEVEIKNDIGNAIPVSWQYGNGASIIPWEVQVARGKISGVQGLSISGYQSAVPDTWVPIWGNPTAYTYLPSAQQIRVWSSSASDTNIAVTITGLDSDYAIITDTVTLTNGVTGVLTTKNFFRVNSLAILADPMNVGIISAGNSSKTITLATIEASAGRSQMSIYTVPAGYTFYLTQVNVYTNQVGSQTGLYRSYTVGATGVINIILTFPFTDNYVSRKVVPRPYSEKTDIQWQAQSSQGTSRVGFQVEGYLISNSVA